MNNISINLDKRAFKKPMCEVMMNQQYFNGIGNYLRAEILGRIDDNPFRPAHEYITRNRDLLFELCKKIPLESYRYKIEKGMTYDGKEPFLKYYKSEKSLSVEDGGGRTFWYDYKWKRYNCYE